MEFMKGSFVAQNMVLVWKLPMEYSQSRYNGRTKPSNACTIIALKMIEYIDQNEVCINFPHLRVYRDQITHRQSSPLSGWNLSSANGKGNISFNHREIPAAGADVNIGVSYCEFLAHTQLRRQKIKSSVTIASMDDQTILKQEYVNALVYGIVHGNHCHAQAMISMNRGVKRQNFTIPDAIKATNTRAIKEMGFTLGSHFLIVQALEREIRAVINNYESWSSKHNFMLVIAGSRTITIVHDKRTQAIAVFDSHSHKNHGAFMAVSHVQYLKYLCQWIFECLFPEVLEPVQHGTKLKFPKRDFELSVIRYITAPCKKRNFSELKTKEQMKGEEFNRPPSKVSKIQQQNYMITRSGKQINQTCLPSNKNLWYFSNEK